MIICLHVWRCEQYGMMLAQLHKLACGAVASAAVRVHAAIVSVFLTSCNFCWSSNEILLFTPLLY